MGILLSDDQYYGNKKRTIKKGLITFLDANQLESLALNYYGIQDDEGNIIGYECPYSGEIIDGVKKLVLEHIIPVNSGGGTTLFNCIPTSELVNKRSEKGTKNLLDWWVSSKYFSVDRLIKLVNYILDGYEITFENKKNDYIDESKILLDIKGLEDNEDNIKEYQDTILNTKRVKNEKHIATYYGFLIDCVGVLKNNYNIDTTIIEQRIKMLKNNNVFNNIDKNFDNFYLAFNQVLKEILEEEQIDLHNQYSYSMNIDLIKLMNGINLDEINIIQDELKERFHNIKRLLEQNGLTLNDYFESLLDLKENIIYKIISDITQKDIDYLYENVALTVETKIKKFIEMLNEGNQGILRSSNTQTFKGTSIKINDFWNKNKEEIKQKLFEELKDNPEYDTARKVIVEYEFQNQSKNQSRELSPEVKIKKFIEMLNEGNQGILIKRNTQIFKGTDIPINQFWKGHKEEIKQKLFGELKDNPEYNTARKVIGEYEFQNQSRNYSMEEKIKKFIEMLNEGNQDILRQSNTQTFKGTDININTFWKDHKEEIKQKLFGELKDNPEYNTARKVIGEYERTNQSKNESRELSPEEKIKIFIEMLNEGNQDILIRPKSKPNMQIFKGTGISIKTFWQDHKEEIKQILFEELKNDSKYDIARKTVLEYCKVSSYEELLKKEKLKEVLKKLKQEKKKLAMMESRLDDAYETRRVA